MVIKLLMKDGGKLVVWKGLILKGSINSSGISFSVMHSCAMHYSFVFKLIHRRFVLCLDLLLGVFYGSRWTNTGGNQSSPG